MRIIMLLLIMKDEKHFTQVQFFLKIRFKILEKLFFFLKISLHFFVEDVKPFYLIFELFFTSNNEGGVDFFLLALQTDGRIDGQTDRRTDLRFFLKSPRHTDSNGI